MNEVSTAVQRRRVAGLRRGFAVAAVALLVAASGCGDSDGGDDELVFSDPLTPIAVSAGQQFAIELEANPTTGYSWELADSYDEAVVTFVGEQYDADDADLVGSGGMEQLQFVAGASGSTVIALDYVRPWEEGVEPAREVSFQVEVG